jgi:hypothetical protein|tara:strand:+ start:919 stop:1320 length:402 start_codon:yes stop_codon:yes gene_type:complete
MVQLTLLILSLLLGACQTTEVVPTKQSVDCSPSLIKSDSLHSILVSQNKNITWRELGEEDLNIFMSSFNKTSPPSDISADLVRFYYITGASHVYMLISLGKCVKQAGPMPLHMIETWLQGRSINTIKKKEVKI